MHRECNPCTLYITETWAMTSEVEIVDRYDSRMLRLMVKVRWDDHITNEKLGGMQFQEAGKKTEMVCTCDEV